MRVCWILYRRAMSHFNSEDQVEPDKVEQIKPSSYNGLISVLKIPWSHNLRQEFHRSMLSTNKNFKVISLTIGKSVDECHRYYYGHYKSSSDYYIFKQMRRLKLIDNESLDKSWWNDNLWSTYYILAFLGWYIRAVLPSFTFSLVICSWTNWSKFCT